MKKKLFQSFFYQEFLKFEMAKLSINQQKIGQTPRGNLTEISFNRTEFAYSVFFLGFKSEGKSINTPNKTIPKPDQRLIFTDNETLYMSSFPMVASPKIPSNIPKIRNIKPIGIFISSMIILFRLPE